MNIRTRVSLAFALVIALALALAGAAFIALRRGDRERQALEHLATVAPQITLELRSLQRAGATDAVGELLRQAAREREVRVLLVDRRGIVTEDSEASLRGRTLDIPPSVQAQRGLYRTWNGRGPSGERLTFLYVPQGAALRGLRAAAAPPPEMVVVAVPEETVAGAWRDLLPALAWAGALALVASLVVAAVIARSITRPVVLLTDASEAMARGDFEHDIPTGRSDEVGRLAQAFNRMAREVGRSQLQMRALVANVSHDLKTPLTSILGFSQALRDGAIDAPLAVAEASAIIHAEAERVQALVDDLLYLSELESGHLPVARDPVDLGVLTMRAARRFAPTFADRQMRLDLTADPGVVVWGDAAKLERILDNLLDNAAKYGASGGDVRVQVLGGERAQVRVFNSGSYISAADLPRVFDRFRRLDHARGDTTRGNGLGLAIARELVELHGGTLSVTSDGDGTTFIVTLPARAAEQATPAVPLRPGAALRVTLPEHL